MTQKYIIVKDKGAILFPVSISHDQIRASLGQEAESGGLADFKNGVCTMVYSTSHCLNLRVFPGDEYIINDSLSRESFISSQVHTTESLRLCGLYESKNSSPGMISPRKITFEELNSVETLEYEALIRKCYYDKINKKDDKQEHLITLEMKSGGNWLLYNWEELKFLD